MLVKNISIENFKGIPSMTFVPADKIAIVTGYNGSGKTSFLQAIKTALTGKSPKHPIREGAAEARVCITYDSGDKIEWIFTQKGTKVRLNDKATTIKSVTAWMEALSGTTVDAVNVCSSQDILREMGAGGLGEYMAGIGFLPATLTVEDIIRVCGLSESAKDRVRDLFPAVPNTFGMSEIDEAYDVVKSELTCAKRDLKEAQDLIASFDGKAKPRNMKQIEAELGALCSHDAKQAAYQKALAAYQKEKARREQMLATKQDLVSQITALGTVAPVDQQEYAHWKSLSAQWTEQRNNAMVQRNLALQNCSMFQKSLDALRQSGCPLSPHLKCTADKEPLIAEIEAALTMNAASAEDALASAKALEEKMKKASGRIAEMDAQDQQLRRVESLHAQLSTLEALIPPPPAEPDAPVVPVGLEQLKSELRKELDNAKAWEQYEYTKKRVPEMETEVAMYKELNRALSPKDGVRQKIVAVAMQPFVDHCNDRAARLGTSYKVDMEVNGGVHLFLDNGTTKVPLEAASTGEQALMMFLLADAINAVTGSRTLMIDNLEQLDVNAFSALLTTISNPVVMAEYDLIVLASVEHPDLQSVIAARPHLQHIAL